MSVSEVALSIGRSKRRVQRIRSRVAVIGSAAVIHGNRGRVSSRRVSDDIRAQVLTFRDGDTRLRTRDLRGGRHQRIQSICASFARFSTCGRFARTTPCNLTSRSLTSRVRAATSPAKQSSFGTSSAVVSTSSTTMESASPGKRDRVQAHPARVLEPLAPTKRKSGGFERSLNANS